MEHITDIVLFSVYKGGDQPLFGLSYLIRGIAMVGVPHNVDDALVERQTRGPLN